METTDLKITITHLPLTTLADTFDIEKFQYYLNKEYSTINRIDAEGNTYFCNIMADNTVDLNDWNIIDVWSIEEEEQVMEKELHKMLYEQGIINPESRFIY